METTTGHEVGKTYRSTIWGNTYTVLGTADLGWAMGVEVQTADGRILQHCTDRGLDPIVEDA